MDRVTRSEGLGRAPFHGVFHTIVSIIILGLSAYLYHHFMKGGDDYIPELGRVYLYDLIVSVLAIGGGLLICLYVCLLKVSKVTSLTPSFQTCHWPTYRACHRTLNSDSLYCRIRVD
jgi:hypothetical protein